MNIIGENELARIPAEPLRSADLLPGLRFTRAISMRTLGFPLAFIAMMALTPLFVLAGDRTAMLALRATETTSGRVEAVEPGRGCQDGSTEISYSFVSRAGVAFRGRKTACARSEYERVRPGDTVPVVYVKANPGVNALAGASNTGGLFYLPFLLFPLFGLFFLVPLVSPRISQLRKERKLFRAGTLAKGRVVFVSLQRDSFWPGWPMPTRGEVFIAIRLRSGEEQEVKAVCTNDWLLGQLAHGSEVNVCVKGSNAVLLENYFR